MFKSNIISRSSSSTVGANVPSARSIEDPIPISLFSLPVLYGEELLAAKATLTAASTANSSLRGKTKKKGLSTKTVSKVYYQQGPRPGIMKSIGLPVISTMLNFDTVLLSTSTTVPTYGSLFFRLSYFDNYTQYTSLFDQYKIDEVEVWIENTKTAAVVTQSKWVTCVDQDDANVPTSYNQVADRINSIQSGNMEAHYHRFQPHMAVALYSGTFTSYGNAAPDWIDSASPDVQHFGLKAASVATTDAAMSYNLFCRARVSFRATGL